MSSGSLRTQIEAVKVLNNDWAVVVENVAGYFVLSYVPASHVAELVGLAVGH